MTAVKVNQNRKALNHKTETMGWKMLKHKKRGNVKLDDSSLWPRVTPFTLDIIIWFIVYIKVLISATEVTDMKKNKSFSSLVYILSCSQQNPDSLTPKISVLLTCFLLSHFHMTFRQAPMFLRIFFTMRVFCILHRFPPRCAAHCSDNHFIVIIVLLHIGVFAGGPWKTNTS